MSHSCRAWRASLISACSAWSLAIAVTVHAWLTPEQTEVWERWPVLLMLHSAAIAVTIITAVIFLVRYIDLRVGAREEGYVMGLRHMAEMSQSMHHV